MIITAIENKLGQWQMSLLKAITILHWRKVSLYIKCWGNMNFHMQKTRKQIRYPVTSSSLYHTLRYQCPWSAAAMNVSSFLFYEVYKVTLLPRQIYKAKMGERQNLNPEPLEEYRKKNFTTIGIGFLCHTQNNPQEAKAKSDKCSYSKSESDCTVKEKKKG